MEFSKDTIDKIRGIVKIYETANSAADRKKARQKMQKLNFKMTEFGIRNITSLEFERLIKSHRIKIKNDSTSSPKLNIHSNKVTEIEVANQNEMIQNICNNILDAEYQVIDWKNISNQNTTGLYALRLKAAANLPNQFQKILDERDHRIIYFGKAETQTLGKRLGQELYAKGHGTFYRSIGAVLGFLPEASSLVGKKNQNNYKFSAVDNQKIVKWIEKNLEIAIFPITEKFEIEKYIISGINPLLNDTHNSLSLQELKQLKNKCRVTARN